MRNNTGGDAVGQLTTAALPFWVSSENKYFCDQRETLVAHIYLPQQHDAAITAVSLSSRPRISRKSLCIDRERWLAPQIQLSHG